MAKPSYVLKFRAVCRAALATATMRFTIPTDRLELFTTWLKALFTAPMRAATALCACQRLAPIDNTLHTTTVRDTKLGGDARGTIAVVVLTTFTSSMLVAITLDASVQCIVVAVFR